MGVKVLKQIGTRFEMEINNKLASVSVIMFDPTRKIIHLEVNGHPYRINIYPIQSAYVVCLHNTNIVIVVPKCTKTTNYMSFDSTCKLEQSSYNFITTEADLLIRSPLSGRVVKIFVKNNDIVYKNTPVLVIESMKMENEICAPFDAFVKNILISEGNLVQQNQVLMTFENKGDGNVGKSYNEKTLQGG